MTIHANPIAAQALRVRVYVPNQTNVRKTATALPMSFAQNSGKTNVRQRRSGDVRVRMTPTVNPTVAQASRVRVYAPNPMTARKIRTARKGITAAKSVKTNVSAKRETEGHALKRTNAVQTAVTGVSVKQSKQSLRFVHSS